MIVSEETMTVASTSNPTRRGGLDAVADLPGDRALAGPVPRSRSLASGGLSRLTTSLHTYTDRRHRQTLAAIHIAACSVEYPVFHSAATPSPRRRPTKTG